jgi:(4S)-4-hydroxy-5-phosphonooxypentane-2,3-dione isomerase
MYIVTAKWTTRQGEEETVAQAIRSLTTATREETGCLLYQAHRHLEDRNVFFFYEQFVDKKSFEDHVAAPYVAEYSRSISFPLLEAREPLGYYEPLE